MPAPDFLARSLSELPQLLDGAITTLWISATAVACGFFIGVLTHVLTSSRSRLLAWPAHAYVSLFRGTPVLAQLLVFYYLPSAFGLDWPGTLAAVVGLSLNTAAYQSQILGAGFRAIPPGQIEAARTFNLTRQQTLWRIEVPQVLAITLPALVSEMIDVVKASAVISVISVTDLMRIGQQLSSATYRPLEIYSLVAVVYLLITTLLALSAHAYQRHLAQRR